jgi:hypothetical protein
VASAILLCKFAGSVLNLLDAAVEFFQFLSLALVFRPQKLVFELSADMSSVLSQPIEPIEQSDPEQ